MVCPWNSPSKNTKVGCHSLLQGIFLTQGSILGLLHCRQILYQLNYQGIRKEAAVKWSEVAQSCPTLWPHGLYVAHQTPRSMGFSRHEYWKWVAISFSMGSSWPRDRTQVSRIVGRCFTVWATREAPKKQTYLEIRVRALRSLVKGSLQENGEVQGDG